MKSELSYQGATLELHYDGMTGTYLGSLQGLPGGPVSVQAATYDDLLEAFHQAVDMHPMNLAIMARFMAGHGQDTPERIDPIVPPAPHGSEQDPFRHRQFLR